MEILLIIIIILLLIYIMKLHFYKKIYTNSTNGVSVIENNTIIDCNNKLVTLFKYNTKEDFLAAHPLQLAPPFQKNGNFSFSEAEEMMAIAKKKGSCRFSWICLTKHGEEKNMEIDIIKVNTFFRREKFFVIWRDIDKRVAIEEKLKKLNENLENIVDEKIKKNKKQKEILFQQSKQAQIGEMLSMIAHQWRQPLGAISAAVIDLQFKIITKTLHYEEFLQYTSEKLQTIEDFTQTLTHTIDDFRDYYRFTKNKQKTDIKSTIDKACKIIESCFQEDNIAIEIICTQNISIPIFENEIIQVLLSILQNAKDNFIHKNIKNPKVSIEIYNNEQRVTIKISDNGEGIDEENLEKIFDPYFTTKENKNGTGLGLYMVQKIIQEHHDGTIKAGNSKDGAYFQIDL